MVRRATPRSQGRAEAAFCRAAAGGLFTSHDGCPGMCVVVSAVVSAP
jgi:hypothetical protein